MALKDSQVTEIHDQLEKIPEKQDKDILQGLAPRSRYIIAIIAGLIIWQVYSSGAEFKDYLMLGSILALVLYIMGKKDNKLLTEREIKIRTYEQLEWKTKHHHGGNYEIDPQNYIRMSPYCKLRHNEGSPWYWDVGALIINRHSSMKTPIVCEVNPHTGDLKGIKLASEGFTGKESPDLRYIKHPELQDRLRAVTALGKRGKKVPI